MTNRKEAVAILLLVLLCCAGMALVDGVLKPGYWGKSAIKAVLFLLCPLLYSLKSRAFGPRSLFLTDRRSFLSALLLGGAVYGVILAAFFLLRGVFDFSGITTALTGDVGVSRQNFVTVAVYIALVNSLLEEFFFRGFAFLTLKKVSSRRLAYCFSAACFAAYHITMMIGWFSVGICLLALVGLAAGAVIFNFLDEKGGSLYPSWIVHIFANLSINTVGLILFGIL